MANTMKTTAPAATEAVIRRLIEQRGPGKTICPSEAARALAQDSADWRSLLAPVRRAAVDLAGRSEAVITRKGKPVDPKAFKGVYRIGLPTKSAK